MSGPVYTDKESVLIYREKWTKGGDTIGTARYTNEEMADLFSVDERTALRRGFQVTKNKVTYIDAVQAALKVGL